MREFLTDDQIADRLDGLERSLQQLGNGLDNLQATIPTLARDAHTIADKITALRRLLGPAEPPADTPPALLL